MSGMTRTNPVFKDDRMAHKSKAKAKNRSSERTPVKAPAPANRTELKPKPIDNERIEDLAVFSKVHRDQLFADLQSEATCIGDSLDAVYGGNFESATTLLKDISRASPYADWRLFIRGLIAFYQDDLENARLNWYRLDQSRRPSRIAIALYHTSPNAAPWEGAAQPDPKQVEAANELRHRPQLINDAKRLASKKPRNSKDIFSVSNVADLRLFCDKYRKSDREFVTRFSQACVRYCFGQPNMDVFKLVTQSVAGPEYDPRWKLHGYCYSRMFNEANDELKSYSDDFIKVDLPKLQILSMDVKQALSSKIRIGIVQGQMASQSQGSMLSMFSMMFSGPRYDLDEMTKLARMAIKDYPKNQSAHELLIELLEMQVGEDDISDSNETKLIASLINAKENFVLAFPDEVDTSIELVDHYFDEDKLDKVKTLVDALSQQRINDPRIKAFPWKLKLREALSLCRLKTNVSLARRALDEAESIWPMWLNKNWLPFLQAAIALRGGDQQTFDQLSQAARNACGATPLVGDLMTFAALQSVNYPGPALKKFREPVDAKSNQAKSIETSELCSIASFCWDLARTGLTNKGYAIHASRFGKALCERIQKDSNSQKHPAFEDVCRFITHHSLWKQSYDMRLPAWLENTVMENHKVFAAVAIWFLDEEYSGRWFAEREPQIEALKEYARTEADPFYRYQFEEVFKDASAKVAEFKSLKSSKSSKSNFFSPLNGRDDDDDDDDDDDCQCPNCTARRARERSKPGIPSLQGAFGEDDDDDFGGSEEEGFFDNTPPPIPRSAQELKDMRRKRQKELDNIRKRSR